MSNQAPTIGSWVYHCCDADLYQITTQEDLDDLLDDDNEVTYRVLPTKKEALLEIRCSFINYPDEQARIDEEIAML